MAKGTDAPATVVVPVAVGAPPAAAGVVPRLPSTTAAAMIATTSTATPPTIASWVIVRRRLARAAAARWAARGRRRRARAPGAGRFVISVLPLGRGLGATVEPDPRDDDEHASDDPAPRRDEWLATRVVGGSRGRAGRRRGRRPPRRGLRRERERARDGVPVVGGHAPLHGVT